MLTWLFILVRIVANPLSNVFQKQLAERSASPIFVIGLVHLCLALACLPWLWIRGGISFVPADVWINMLVAAMLAVAGNTLLVYALRSTDLSLLGPINAYKSVIGLIIGVFLIGEYPSLIGITGILLIVAGSYFVVDRRVDQPRHNAFVLFFRERGVQLRFAALFLSATEAIFLKRAILLSTPWTVFVLWSILGVPLAGVAAPMIEKATIVEEAGSVRRFWGTYLALAITTGLMQLATVLTFGRFQVGYSLALFQLSTIVSVLLGHRYFQERNIRKRLGGSVVMAVGAVLIVMSAS
jgi:drug/metabolite transporter (DMT)-like permease